MRKERCIIEKKINNNLEYLHNFAEPTKDRSRIGSLTKPNNNSVKFVKKHKHEAN